MTRDEFLKRWWPKALGLKRSPPAVATDLDALIAAAREEQREACAHDAEERVGCASTYDEIRSVPLTATPLADRIQELEKTRARHEHASCAMLADRCNALERERDEALRRVAVARTIIENAVDLESQPAWREAVESWLRLH